MYDLFVGTILRNRVGLGIFSHAGIRCHRKLRLSNQSDDRILSNIAARKRITYMLSLEALKGRGRGGWFGGKLLGALFGVRSGSPFIGV